MLHEETGVAAFLGVQAGDHLMYIAEAGSDSITGFEARTNIRRPMLATAGGKALLVARSDNERESYLRRRHVEEADLVEQFLEEYAEIKRTRIATNMRRGSTRFGIATVVHNQFGEAVAAITLVGLTAEVQPRVHELSKRLLRHVDSWRQRSMTPREAI
jgi:DNA-binding IclR family transcriptional regulator